MVFALELRLGLLNVLGNTQPSLVLDLLESLFDQHELIGGLGGRVLIGVVDISVFIELFFDICELCSFLYTKDIIWVTCPKKTEGVSHHAGHF